MTKSFKWNVPKEEIDAIAAKHLAPLYEDRQAEKKTDVWGNELEIGDFVAMGGIYAGTLTYGHIVELPKSGAVHVEYRTPLHDRRCVAVRSPKSITKRIRLPRNLGLFYDEWIQRKAADNPMPSPYPPKFNTEEKRLDALMGGSMIEAPGLIQAEHSRNHRNVAMSAGNPVDGDRRA